MDENKLLLLGMLEQQEMHGYQITELIESELHHVVALKKPTAYYTLNKMCEDGWVTFNEEQIGGRPPRRTYQLTPAGKQAFHKLLRENLGSYHPARFGGDIGIAYLDTLPVGEAIERLEERREAIDAYRREVEKVPEHSGSLQWMVAHQQHHLQAELAWLDRLIIILKERKQT